jgi:GntR family transcriptional regulator
VESINRDSDRPAYKQLADILRDRITSGQLPAGAEIPAEAELAERHGLGKNTVRQAMAILRAEGLVVSERGRYTRVRPVRVIASQRYELGKRNYGDDRDSAFAREHGIPWADFDLTREYRIVPASPRVAAALHLDPGTDVFERRFTHATGGVMLRLSRSYLSAARFAGTILTDPDEPLWPGGTVGQLAALGVDITHVRTEVTARAASLEESQTLGLAAGAPVLDAWRIQLAADEPVETAQHVYPPGAQMLVFDVPVGRPPDGNRWKDVSYD